MNSILNKAITAAFAGTAMVSGLSIAQVVYDSTPRYVQTNPAYVGVVESIDVVRGGNEGNKAAGTILGGVIGGVIGHQFGSGRGNDAATAAGAVGGAIAGHEIAENRSGRGGYRVNVRLDNGGLRSFYQEDVYGLNVGDRVQIDNDRVYRLAATTYDQPVYRSDAQIYRSDAPVYRSDAPVYRSDAPVYRSDAPVYRSDTIPADSYRVTDAPVVRYLPNGRLDRRVYVYDSQGYRVDQWGNRYDSEGYWVDERGNRQEFQDPPMGDDIPNRLNHPQ